RKLLRRHPRDSTQNLERPQDLTDAVVAELNRCADILHPATAPDRSDHLALVRTQLDSREQGSEALARRKDRFEAPAPRLDPGPVPDDPYPLEDPFLDGPVEDDLLRDLELAGQEPPGTPFPCAHGQDDFPEMLAHEADQL